MPSNSAPVKRRRDYRLATLLLVIAVVVALGYGVSLLPSRGVQATAPQKSQPAPHAPMGFAELKGSSGKEQDVSESEFAELVDDPANPNDQAARKILDEADRRIKAGSHEEAIVILNQQRALVQKYPESYLLLGRALEGRQDYTAARDFYRVAIDRKPYMADAYWGFATASEQLDDLESALGAMRSYLHTEAAVAQNQLKIAQARSSIWEWESKLGRGPWGPTKGVPPGYTASEIKRDGKGVGIKMPIQNEQADGPAKSEMKVREKVKVFK